MDWRVSHVWKISEQGMDFRSKAQDTPFYPLPEIRE